MRILHCIETIYSGGVERTRLSLVEKFGQGASEHRIVCSLARGPVADALRRAGADIIEIGGVADVSYITRLRRLDRVVRSFRPDVLHGAVIDGYMLSAVVGRLRSVPLTIMEETSDPQNRSWRGHLLARGMAGLSSHCIAVSPGVGRYLTDFLKIPQSKISVINNGVPVPKSLDRASIALLKEELEIPQSAFVIGVVGRMHDESHKRFGDVIRSLTRLEASNSYLLLVGEGREREGLEGLARELGVADRCRFVGFQFQVGPYYAVMDVFVCPSAREAFGLVNAEAMRAGLPVIASRVGGIPDIVDDGRTGFLFDVGDLDTMTGYIGRLASDSGLRRAMGLAGRVRADVEFSEESYVERVSNLYKSLR